MEHWYTPSEPGRLDVVERILVLAPHPDDEIFGCGGLLALYKRQGAEIDVSIFTDGAGYNENSVREKVFAERMEESNNALQLLGLSAANYCGLKDRGLASTTNLSLLVEGLIQKHRPDMLLLPSLWEIHPDHVALARAGIAAAESWLRSSQTCPSLMFYEIGHPQRTNFLVDITETWEIKLQAMQCFASQLSQQDYVRHISGLNSYRTYTLPANVKWAEAYFRVTPEDLKLALKQGGDIAHRLIGRWVELALCSAESMVESMHNGLAEANRQLLANAKAIGAKDNEIKRITESEQLLKSQLDEIRRSRSWRWTSFFRSR